MQPDCFESLEELEQTILAFIGHYNQTAKPIQWSYTVEKLERKLGANYSRLYLTYAEAFRYQRVELPEFFSP